MFQVAPDPNLRHVHFSSPAQLTDSESEDDSPSVIMCAGGSQKIYSSPPKPLVNNYIPINDCNQNKNSNNNNSEIDLTHKPKSVIKDSYMAKPKNKN